MLNYHNKQLLEKRKVAMQVLISLNIRIIFSGFAKKNVYECYVQWIEALGFFPQGLREKPLIIKHRVAAIS